MSYLILLFLFFFSPETFAAFSEGVEGPRGSPFLHSFAVLIVMNWPLIIVYIVSHNFPHFMCNRCQVNSLILVIFCLFVLIVPSFKKHLIPSLQKHLHNRCRWSLSYVSECLYFLCVIFFSSDFEY